MNIIFNSLEINDFQSIGHAKVELDNQGTVLVKGINEYEENTLSNGSGKSSIFEALYFTLYGKTTTGLMNVSNRYTGNTYKLDLKFSIDGIEYEIIREGTKITVLENGEESTRRNKTDTEAYIKENILKLSPDIFLNIVYLAQGFKSRLSALTAGGRKDQIEEILGTDEITEEFRKQVQNQKDKYTDKLNETNGKISYNNGNIDQLNSNIEKYKNEIERINEENKSKPSKEDLTKKINDINIELEKEEQNQKDINDKISKIKEENSSKQIEISKIDSEIANYQNDKNQIISQLNEKLSQFKIKKQQEINNFETTYRDIESKSNNIITLAKSEINNNKLRTLDNNKQIETLKTSDKCPTCGRKFENANEEHILNEIQKLIDQNQKLSKEDEENNKRILEEQNIIKQASNNKTKEIENVQNQINELNQSVQKSLEEINVDIDRFKEEKQKSKIILQQEIKSIDTETGTLTAINARIMSYKASITDLQNQINNLKIESTEQYETLIKECNEKLVNIIKENEELQKEVSALEEKIGIASHCTSLISKEFKNYLLKSAIDFLNSKLDYYSNLLFSNEQDKIKFVQEGNKLDIYLGDALFESLSGGEKRKVDIAIMLAQKDLANNMSSTYSNILILDEVTDGLDSKSIDIVTSILMNVSKDISSMFVVSHKDTVIGYDNQIVVVKGKDRISHIM